MDKKFGIALGASLLALAVGIIALCRPDDVKRAEKELKRAAKKVKRKTKKLEDMVEEKVNQI